MNHIIKNNVQTGVSEEVDWVMYEGMYFFPLSHRPAESTRRKTCFKIFMFEF